MQVHPFFKGVDWNNLYTARSPYVPKVEHELDTQNFEPYEEVAGKGLPGDRARRRTDPNFIGYTFKNFEAVHSDEKGTSSDMHMRHFGAKRPNKDVGCGKLCLKCPLLMFTVL